MVAKHLVNGDGWSPTLDDTGLRRGSGVVAVDCCTVDDDDDDRRFDVDGDEEDDALLAIVLEGSATLWLAAMEPLPTDLRTGVRGIRRRPICRMTTSSPLMGVDVALICRFPNAVGTCKK